MSQTSPLNLRKWVEENRHLLKPPVGNRQIWEDREFMVTVVGGPNCRKDFHINEGEEFFYQLEGNIILKVIEDGKIKSLELREGDIYLLPPNVPHSPQRPEGTIGLVIERKRQPQEQDGFLWFCEKCHSPLHEEKLHLTHIVKQLPPLFKQVSAQYPEGLCPKCVGNA